MKFNQVDKKIENLVENKKKIVLTQKQLYIDKKKQKSQLSPNDSN